MSAEDKRKYIGLLLSKIDAQAKEIERLREALGEIAELNPEVANSRTAQRIAENAVAAPREET
jgi:hypothetical protein